MQGRGKRAGVFWHKVLFLAGALEYSDAYLGIKIDTGQS